MRGFLLVGVGFVACSGDGGADTGAPVCVNELKESLPADGLTGVYYRASIRMTLDKEDTSATISLADDQGDEVAGASRVEGELVVFAPASPLDREATYTATLTYECGAEAVTFTTSTTGDPLDVDPTGRVYDLDLTQGVWAEPQGVGEVLNTVITGDISLHFMPSAIDTDGGTIDFIGAAPDPTNPNAQDPKATPLLACDATWTEPHFEASADSLPIAVAGFDVGISNLEVKGDFSVDGSRIEIEAVGGEIDTRELPTTFGDLCTLAQGYGVSCSVCRADPTSTTCLVVRVEHLVLPHLASVEPLTSGEECPQ